MPDTTNFAENFASIELFDYGAPETGYWYFDEYKIDDAEYPTWNNFTARPTSDISDGSWLTNSGGSNLYSVIDEVSTDDTDFIKSGIDPATDTCEVLLEAHSDPEVSTGQSYTYRFRKDIGDKALNLTASLYCGTTLIHEEVHNNVSAAWQEKTVTLSDAEADNITDYGNLRIRFVADG